MERTQNGTVSGSHIPYGRWKRLGILLFLGIAICAHWIKGSWGDKAWLLETSHLWLLGKHLYNDIFQPNLPMIVWLYAIPVWLSQHIPVADQHLLVLITLGIIGVSVALCHRIMGEHPYFAAHPQMRTRHTVWVLFILICFASVLFFGDREHLVMVLMFPFFLRNMPSLAERKIPHSIRIIISVMAALGPCIKPHAVVLLAGVLIARIFRERSLRAVLSLEAVVVTVVMVGYFAVMLLTTSEYFTIVLPMLLKTYSVVNNGVKTILSYATSAFMLMVVLGEFRPRYSSPLRHDIYYLLFLCISGLGYALMSNGWNYTFYPLQSFIFVLTWYIYWEFRWLRAENVSEPKAAKQFYSGAMMCRCSMVFSLCASVIPLCGFVYFGLTENELDYDAGDKQIIHASNMIKEEGVHTIGAISYNYSMWSLLMRREGVVMSTRFNHIFMLKRFFMEGEEFTHTNQWIPEYVANAYAEDLNKNQPELVFVDSGENFYKTGKNVDIIQYFSAYPAFAGAWKSYHPHKVMDVCKDDDVQEKKDVTVWCKIYVFARNKENAQ